MFQFPVNLVDNRCTLITVEICRCHASTLQLELIVPARALDHPRGTVFHCVSVLLHWTLQHIISNCLNTNLFYRS